MDFLVIPDTYYENLRARLKDAPIKVEEDLDVVRYFNLDPWTVEGNFSGDQLHAPRLSNSGCIKPLTPMSDQQIIFPYNFSAVSSRQVMRRKKISIKGLFVDSIPNSPTHIIRCAMEMLHSVWSTIRVKFPRSAAQIFSKLCLNIIFFRVLASRSEDFGRF